MSLFDADTFLTHCTSSAGVYRMYNEAGEVIYVGKAKNLKKRLASYFQKRVDNPKTRALVAKIANIEVTVVHSETDALILENDYIKQYMPKYNVLLRDDKSYPYIFLSDHRHPRLAYHRGTRRNKGHYFGPYPNGSAVKASLNLLQKLFPIRQCEDSYYRARSRPCLQHQIGRCSAPCVDYISDGDYQAQVRLASLFLKGQNKEVISALVTKMEQASQALEFEKAAAYRDQIQALNKVTEQQEVSAIRGDLDVIGSHYEKGMAAFHLLTIRDGKIRGSRSYYPKVPTGSELAEVLRSFVLQYYLNEQQRIDMPKEVIFDQRIEEVAALSEAINQKMASQLQFKFSDEVRAERQKFINLATTNAKTAVSTEVAKRSNMQTRYEELAKLLPLQAPITKMECFDISHSHGEATVASCVVFNHEGPDKAKYRKYNIEGIKGGDDYAAMAQVLRRRLAKMNQENRPDIWFIDGGKGQLSMAEAMITTHLPAGVQAPLLVGIAKGEGRKAGLETLFIDGDKEGVGLGHDSPALHLIQMIRDESHRFAITAHKKRRQKARNTSTLEGIAGVGPKRRKALLNHLGGLQEVRSASVQTLSQVPGISVELAQVIHDSFRDG